MNYAAMIAELGQLKEKLSNRSRIEPHNLMLGRLSGDMIDLGPRTVQNYSWKQVSAMTDRVMVLVDELYKAGYVSEEEWCKFLLSEEAHFVPELKTPDSP